MSRAVPHTCTICKLVKTNPVLGAPSLANSKKRSLSDEDQDQENKKKLRPTVSARSVCRLLVEAFLTNVQRQLGMVTLSSSFLSSL